MTSSPKLTTPQRFDIVGSFLRPDVLKRARADFADGVIDFDQLTAVEDEAIRDLVAKEKAAGLGVITDGEFRRATWHLDFMWGFDGIGHNKTDQGVPFHDEQAMIDDTYVTGRLSVDHHPFVDHFAFVKALAGEGTVAKQTIPAPANFLFTISIPSVLEQTERVYPDREELIGDIVAGYRKVVAELYDAATCSSTTAPGASASTRTCAPRLAAWTRAGSKRPRRSCCESTTCCSTACRATLW